MDYRRQAPPILREFLTYHETVKDHSKKTIDEYFLDLRMFLRYMKVLKQNLPAATPLDDLSIDDVDLDFIRSISFSDIYEYLAYLSRDRNRHPSADTEQHGVDAAARARKLASIRSFFKYLTVKAKLLTENPVEGIDSPKLMKSLPRYLTESESIALLSSVQGQNQVRDYCILTLFLNCGLRISELVGLDCADVRDDTLRVLGKGNKVRMLYLNEACLAALAAYWPVRAAYLGAGAPQQTDALFVSNRKTRLTTAAVHKLVKKHLAESGLDSRQYSAHKLRHTAATLMLQNGVDVRTLQEVLGHDHLNTTQIYTHVENKTLRDAAQKNPLAHVKPPASAATRTPDQTDKTRLTSHPRAEDE